MGAVDRSERLREVGLVPTIQRLAVLECLCETTQHPTADEVLSAVRREFPSISRATVYNTLDALTKARMVLQLNVDPAAARYDADLEPHAHFRCRVCRKVYDIEAGGENPMHSRPDGHLIESVRTYAYGVCASCLESERIAPSRSDRAQTIGKEPSASSRGLSSEESPRTKESPTPSSSVPPRAYPKEARNA